MTPPFAPSSFLTNTKKESSLINDVLWPPQCLKFRAERSSDLRKLERLNRLMLSMMCNGPEAADGPLTLYLRHFLKRRSADCLRCTL